MNQRHRDLNTNELEKLMSSATPWMEQHGNKLIYAACAAMLAFALYYYVTQSSSVQRSAGWGEFVSASQSEDYANIATRFKGTPPGQWALLSQANQNLEDGVRGAFSDREGAVSDLNSAREKFEELLNDSKLAPELEERARFGLARCLESLAGDDMSKPVEAYEALLKKFPDTIFKSVVEAQLETLKAPEGKEFYAWFVAQDPKTNKPTTPFDSLPPGHPPVDPGSLIRLPEIPEMLKLPVEGTAPAFPEGADDTTPGADNSTSKGTAPPVPEEAQP